MCFNVIFSHFNELCHQISHSEIKFGFFYAQLIKEEL